MMEILTLEEAIDAYKAEAEQKRLDAALLYDARRFEESKDCIWKAEENRQLVKWLKKLQAYETEFDVIIGKLEERAGQLENILEENSWCDGDEEYRLDEINEIIKFIKERHQVERMNGQNESDFPKLNTNESFSAEVEMTPETKEALKQIIGEVSVFTADFIKYENKETGETAEFVSKRKLREVLEKMRDYRDMEIKGVNFYERPGVAERCFDLLQEVV
jgi:hypothetical protein